MLLEFQTENFKSFKDRIIFSMVPAPKQKGLDYSILNTKVGKKDCKALCSAVVYGPNASGKTNILGAIQTFKSIVLRGNIKNSPPLSPNPTDYYLELIPNNTLKESKTVFFLIKFIHNNYLINYSFSLDLGFFMDKDYERSVVNEELEINEKRIFIRENKKLTFDNLKDIKDLLIPNYEKNLKTIHTIVENSMQKEDLFLMNGFKTILSPTITELVSDYLNNKLEVAYHADLMRSVPQFSSKTAVDRFMNEAVKDFGINSNELVYVKSEKNDEPILCSVMDDKKVLPADVFESYGTVRFVNLFPMIVHALKNGGTLVIDEFDSSIHPMAIMSIIGVFHNDEINKNLAQLIFNTHNPLYLNGNILRRDEIKFVERDDETKCSRHYSLSDFGTKGTNARKGKDYMDNYFISAYGAIRDIDFSDTFKKIVEE